MSKTEVVNKILAGRIDELREDLALKADAGITSDLDQDELARLENFRRLDRLIGNLA